MALVTVNNRGTTGIERNRNLLYNGDMSVWQRLASNGRNAPTSDQVSSSTYNNSTTVYPTYVPGADRYILRSNGSATFQISRSVDVPSGQGFPFSYKIVNNATENIRASTTNRYVLFEQRIPQEDIQHLMYGTADAKSVTVSFWVKSNQTGKVHIGLYGSAQIFDNTPSTNINNVRTYTINAANTWEYKTVTLSGLTNTSYVLKKFNQKDTNSSDYGLLLWQWLDHSAAGSDYWDPVSDVKVDDTWQVDSTAVGYILESGNIEMAGTAGASFQITGYQMEVGTVATDFEFIPFYDQLSRCQRFYYNHQYNTRLTGTTNKNRMYSADWNGSNSATFGQYELPAPMHRTPDYTVTQSGGSASFQMTYSNAVRIQTYDSGDPGHYVYQVHADAEL